jgi:hypothetical protein
VQCGRMLRVAASTLLLSLGPACGSDPPARPAPAPAPAPAPELPAPDVDPTALPVCGKSMLEEPLAAICALGKPSPGVALGCAAPEMLMFCSNTDPGFSKWGCVTPEGLPPVMIMLGVKIEGTPPKIGEIIEPKPISGAVESVEVSVAAPDVREGHAKIAVWRQQVEQWGCRPEDEPSPDRVELRCGRFLVVLHHSDITDRAYVEALTPDYAACWK